ncbi:B51 [miniopterid betaherpesvirus 1]|uniref:B51 n=1 Tax=miniopterid betaherpesvirus 1 TaxID=3070189 RepID=I3VQ37_9BETA|nr:B51 [miniopterid betaherpesvirus 1]AFK83881.1 B51 [miniopterid betaherpesvirus 1]
MSAGDDGGRDGERAGLCRFYDELMLDVNEPDIRFEPMLPKVYEIMLPSLDAKINLINVGQRHAAFLRHVYGSCGDCVHAEILRNKVKLLTVILTKLLDVNGILERKDNK